MPIDAITTDDVLAAVQPIWLTISPTAGILRGRIENHPRCGLGDKAHRRPVGEPGPMARRLPPPAAKAEA
jgi:hypothetical protein